MTTPRTVSLSVLSIDWHGGGSCADLPRSPRARKIISLNFWQLSLRLFAIVQFWTVLSSSQQSLVFTAGTIRYVSPTNLSLSAWSGRKYAALTKYAAGRRPEPCIMLAASRHSCDRRVHVGVPCTMRVIADKSTIQVVDLIGHVKLNNFLHYSLVSRCVKSRAKTWTYGLTDSMLHTMCRRATIAATVV